MTDFRYVKHYQIESDQLRQLKYAPSQIEKMLANGVLPSTVEVRDEPYPDIVVVDETRTSL